MIYSYIEESNSELNLTSMTTSDLDDMLKRHDRSLYFGIYIDPVSMDGLADSPLVYPEADDIGVGKESIIPEDDTAVAEQTIIPEKITLKTKSAAREARNRRRREKRRIERDSQVIDLLCPHCKRHLGNRGALVRHQPVCQTKLEERTCTICSKSFARVNALKSHQRHLCLKI